MAAKKQTTKKTSSTKTKKDSESNVETLEVTPMTSKPNKFLNKKVVLVVLLLALVAVGLYLANKYLVVVWVDKKPITRFEVYQIMDKKYGQAETEQLVVEQLLINEGKNRGVVVSSQDVDKAISDLEKQRGGADQLNQFLQLQGLDRAELANRIRLQLLIQKLFGNNITVSDEEVNKFIEENKDQLGEVKDETKTQIKSEITQQKIGTNFQNWLKEAEKSSRVQRN